jgi:hypothetical protein
MTAAAYLGQQLAQLAKLPDAEVLIQEVETKQARRDALVAIDDDFHGWNSKAYQAGHDIKRLGDLTAIGKLLQGVEKSQARRGQLVDIFDNYTQYSQSYAQAAAIVEKCGDLGAAAKSLNKVSANLDRLAVLQVVTWEHDRAADRVTEAAKADAAAGIDLERAEAELAAAWEEVGGICPTCGTAVKIDHKHKGVEV